MTKAENCHNQRKAQKISVSGLLGASPRRGYWRAAITVGGKAIHIGYYKTPEEAHAAYVEKKRLLHTGNTI